MTRTAPWLSASDGPRPGDDYNRRITWPVLLESHGWMHVYDRGETAFWRRPGKAHGISATTNHAGADLFYPFSSSTEFEPDRSYSKFGVYALLEHGGDYARAAGALAEQGYGQAAARSMPRRAAHGPAPDPSGPLSPLVTCLRDVQPEEVSWLWPGRVARGKVAFVIGDPGLGKSWITLDIAARVSAARPWPDRGDDAPSAAPVLLLSAEDGLADTIRPRLDRLHADVSRVHHLAVLRTGEHERAIQLADVGALTAAIASVRAQLLIIDPVSAYLGHTDSHRDAEVRGLLAPLARLAEVTRVAIVGVMHLAKSAQKPAIYRAIGSIAFAAAARVVLAVAQDPQSERRLLASVKNNLGVPAAALGYTLTDGRLVWDTAPVDGVDIDALLAGPSFDRAEHREADTWLRQLLVDGRVKSTEIERQAAAAGISRRTLFRAKARLHIAADRVGGLGRGAGAWYWSLPTINSAMEGVAPLTETHPNTPDPTKGATDNDVAPLITPEDIPAWVLTGDGPRAPLAAPFADRGGPPPRPGRCVHCDAPLTHPRAGEPCARCRRQRAEK
jgi:hypothetical protein